ncbi:hypothetical protein [Leisingera sp. JC1]|uniref:hypothetical protein n=1 Tax=Leisingera sp. JC1 TaxID=1855282 RepID=UPI0008032942|nr:hypothetical protein [Leisingera sp. JC1]OBY26835.1 hypothetical protein A9D60_17120 [Leisingera sp. JC1]
MGGLSGVELFEIAPEMPARPVGGGYSRNPLRNLDIAVPLRLDSVRKANIDASIRTMSSRAAALKEQNGTAS